VQLPHTHIPEPDRRASVRSCSYLPRELPFRQVVAVPLPGNWGFAPSYLPLTAQLQVVLTYSVRRVFNPSMCMLSEIADAHLGTASIPKMMLCEVGLPKLVT
jgi:hypothetical protein